MAPSPYGLALRRTTATFPLQARAGAGSSIAPRPHGPPLALARYSPHLSTVRGPTVQARAQRVADPRYVRQTGEPGRAYWRSDLRATRLSAGGFAPLDPKDGASGQRSWSGPRRSLSAAVAHPGLILAGAPVLGGAPVPTGAPVPAGAPGLQRAVAVQRALVLQREREFVLGPAPAVHGPPVSKPAIMPRTTPLHLGVAAVSTAERPAVSTAERPTVLTAERPAVAIPLSSPSAARRPDHRLRGGLAIPAPMPILAPLPTGTSSRQGRLVIASERNRPPFRRDIPVRPATALGPGTALRQYLALPTQEMRPGAAANWARTTKERAAVPKSPGSVAILPVSAARVPTATPLLAAGGPGLARHTGGPARASVEMRGPSSNSATMGLTPQQRAVAKTSSRTPSPGHRPPVPVGQGRGAVHRLTTGPGFLPTSQATVRQSWPDAQPGAVVSREQPRLPRHHELGALPSPLVPGGVRPAHVRAGRVRSGAAARRAPSVPVGDFRVEARRPWFPWRTP